LAFYFHKKCEVRNVRLKCDERLSVFPNNRNYSSPNTALTSHKTLINNTAVRTSKLYEVINITVITVEEYSVYFKIGTQHIMYEARFEILRAVLLEIHILSAVKTTWTDQQLTDLSLSSQ